MFMLGRIPLRHLVYRVHSLPDSMRPLVWDFGQLKPEIEELYTRQIVSRFVSGFMSGDIAFQCFLPSKGMYIQAFLFDVVSPNIT